MPCPHCGVNFMRRNTDCTQCEVCNNCTVREQIRNPKKAPPMETVDILIKVSSKDYKQIEECCINKGLSFTQYFMDYHLPAKKDSVVFMEVPDSIIPVALPESSIIAEVPRLIEKHIAKVEQTNIKRKYNKRK